MTREEVIELIGKAYKEQEGELFIKVRWELIHALVNGDKTTIEDWIEHDGKGMPVSGRAIVDLRFRDGVRICSMPAEHYHDEDATQSNWVHDGCEVDIIKYRYSD